MNFKPVERGKWKEKQSKNSSTEALQILQKGILNGSLQILMVWDI